ncbi:MAG: hypothetical protein GTO71_05250 [Woeseiaceae bacterium]|nr:hypothetical protein [Woeseiaceae bacterium]NIP20504.1 hypothetical protein [Woeseiaceae bacterium]NIS89099.1 hypothetical protein [Woeseiaceae bacterium]
MQRLILVRLAPLVMIVAAAGFWFSDVQESGPYVARNMVPPIVFLLLAANTLRRGEGTWSGSGWRWPLGTAGFAIPALGLSAYLHYAYSVNLDGLFTNASDPQGLFRFLPVYTLVAGGIGFAIGWIVGKNV